MENKLIIHVEIVKQQYSTVTTDSIESKVSQYFISQGKITPGSHLKNVILPEHITSVRVCEVPNDNFNNIPLNIPSPDIEIYYHSYTLSEEGPQEENLSDEQGNGNDDPPASNHWILPCTEFENLWDNLVFNENIKDTLIDYVRTALLFSQHKVDPNVITWNSVVLLHGPPGTGKTSLCKALAQKLSIRLSGKYTHGQLIEINSHSLFSKWFSESGKLVLKMFNKIREWLVDPNGFVCILIDEVESLTHARTASLNNSEPSDSLRVVNAVLTQIDRLKCYPNVLILSTSNISQAIDIAFADRADIKLYIGPPSKLAIYKIFHSCLNEMLRVGLINGRFSDIFDLRTFLQVSNAQAGLTGLSHRLYNLAIRCEGLSGRVLRKMPFLAHSHFVTNTSPSLEMFLCAMESAAIKHINDSKAFSLQNGDINKNVQ